MPEFKKNNESVKLFSYQYGFTLFEVIVSVSIFLVAIIIVSSAYLATQKSYRNGSNKAELTQNTRVMLDRLSRELRQTNNIVTAIPTSSTTPVNEIFFQDGHDTSAITYLRYYLNGKNAMRQHKAFYFSSEPSNYVTWNSLDISGNPPLELILSDYIVGEYFEQIGFWGNDKFINIDFALSKNQSSLKSQTGIFVRN